jgi:hypothetical protein
MMCYYQRHSIKDTPVIDMVSGFKRKSDIIHNARIFNVVQDVSKKKSTTFHSRVVSGKSQKTLYLVAPVTVPSLYL